MPEEKRPDEEDVEGHRLAARADLTGSDDEEDVEGHVKHRK